MIQFQYVETKVSAYWNLSQKYPLSELPHTSSSKKRITMIKKTLYFSNPAYLSLRNGQLVIKMPEVEKSDNVASIIKEQSVVTKPIEDIGLVVLDNRQITLTQGLLAALIEQGCAVVTCDSRSMPIGLHLPLSGNTTLGERFRDQLNASQPLRKQLWQQTIRQKIENQAAVLQEHTNSETRCMSVWATDVRSGDPDNLEARAAAYYWKNIFPELPGFVRGRDGFPPNNLLNYGYAILRAVVARALVASGLLPTLGIHHHNRYNAYPLADDIMEPYRPYVDELVIGLMRRHPDYSELTRDMKAELLTIPTLEVRIDNLRRPLMVAAAITTASLYKCFSGESRKVLYPHH